MEFSIWSALLVSIAAVWLALPIQVVIHEFSHAIAARLMSPSQIVVKLGTRFHGVFRKERFIISFGLYRWTQGNTHFSPNKVSPLAQAIIILAGPVGTLAATAIAWYVTVMSTSLLMKFALIPFVVYGLKILLLSLYPRQLMDRKTGRKIQTDGYQLSQVPWQMHNTASTH